MCKLRALYLSYQQWSNQWLPYAVSELLETYTPDLELTRQRTPLEMNCHASNKHTSVQLAMVLITMLESSLWNVLKVLLNTTVAQT